MHLEEGCGELIGHNVEDVRLLCWSRLAGRGRVEYVGRRWEVFSRRERD